METVQVINLAKESDEALVAAAKCGDTEAFGDLVLRHEQKVLAVAQRITNNREDAQDVAQETFHKAFCHLNTFQEKSRFSTWMTRIAMNEAFMLLRRRRGALEVLPESPVDGEESFSEKFIDQRPSPEESYRLAPRHRRALCRRNGADSGHLNQRREGACFSRTPQVTRDREPWAPE